MGLSNIIIGDSNVPFRAGLHRIRILGKGPTWNTCPGLEAGSETWGIGTMFEVCKIDRLFCMHDPVSEVLTYDRDYIKKLKELKIPIYTAERHGELGTNSIRFPIEEVFKEFDIVYTSSQVCWMIAMAIMLKPKIISFHGIDLINREYEPEILAVEYWCGVAIGRGIKLEIPDESELCKPCPTRPWQYGYSRPRVTGVGMKFDPEYSECNLNKGNLYDEYELKLVPKRGVT